ncbi:hypothetical protein LZC95_51900 [Pendulispora brunnea]|uniref:Uncharacterized protein n=1 Tax=Pendulispora brunnea TaxID=2905690 RepID=A0ABZ2K8C3_9BACT
MTTEHFVLQTARAATIQVGGRQHDIVLGCIERRAWPVRSAVRVLWWHDECGQVLLYILCDARAIEILGVADSVVVEQHGGLEVPMRRDVPIVGGGLVVACGEHQNGRCVRSRKAVLRIVDLHRETVATRAITPEERHLRVRVHGVEDTTISIEVVEAACGKLPILAKDDLVRVSGNLLFFGRWGEWRTRRAGIESPETIGKLEQSVVKIVHAGVQVPSQSEYADAPFR